MRRSVVLYNPQAVFFTMPLGLLAVRSALDPSRYSVRIIDARLEANPHEALVAAAEDAVCVGIGVLTGAPIHDALAASRAVKGRFPALPVVWGGWHPSLFPTATLDEPTIDVSVQGQGEQTFAELVERLDRGDDLAGLPGIAYRNGDRVLQTPPPPTCLHGRASAARLRAHRRARLLREEGQRHSSISSPRPVAISAVPSVPIRSSTSAAGWRCRRRGSAT